MQAGPHPHLSPSPSHPHTHTPTHPHTHTLAPHPRPSPIALPCRPLTQARDGEEEEEEDGTTAPDTVGCWYQLESCALYCESYTAGSIRHLRRQQRRTHQVYSSMMAHRSHLLEAFVAAEFAPPDEASAGKNRTTTTAEPPSSGTSSPAAGPSGQLYSGQLGGELGGHLRLSDLVRLTNEVTAHTCTCPYACTHRPRPPHE